MNTYFSKYLLLGLNILDYDQIIWIKTIDKICAEVYNREVVIEKNAVIEINSKDHRPIYKQFYPIPHTYLEKPNNQYIISIPTSLTQYYMENVKKSWNDTLEKLCKENELQLYINFFNKKKDEFYFEMYKIASRLIEKNTNENELIEYLYNEYLYSCRIEGKAFCHILILSILLYHDNQIIPLTSEEDFYSVLQKKINEIPLNNRRENIINTAKILFETVKQRVKLAINSCSYNDFYMHLCRANMGYYQLLYLSGLNSYIEMPFDVADVEKGFKSTANGLTYIFFLNPEEEWINMENWVQLTDKVILYKLLEYIDSLSTDENPIIPCFMANILKKKAIIKFTLDSTLIKSKLKEIEERKYIDQFIEYNMLTIQQIGYNRLGEKDKVLLINEKICLFNC
jgi:hypothetical protein